MNTQLARESSASDGADAFLNRMFFVGIRYDLPCYSSVINWCESAIWTFASRRPAREASNCELRSTPTRDSLAYRSPHLGACKHTPAWTSSCPQALILLRAKLALSLMRFFRLNAAPLVTSTGPTDVQAAST